MQPTARSIRILAVLLGTLSTGAPSASAQRTPVELARQGLAAAGGCGSSVTPGEAAQFRELQAMGVYDPLPPQEYVFTVPLTYHLVRQSNGSGGLTVAQLDQDIAVLNASYLPAGIRFQRPGTASVIQSDFFFSQITTQFQADLLRQQSPVPNTINVYFVQQFRTDGNVPVPQFLCGQSSFTTDPVQGIIITYSCTSTQGNPSTFTHEMGHYFDLFHTHETAFGAECPDGSNCPIAGDLLCDTPADPTLGNSNTVGCTYTGNEMRCGQGFNPQMANFMNYAASTCRTLFTPQQYDRIVSTLANQRPNLIGAQLSVVWLDQGYSGFEFGTFAFPVNTLPEALALTPAGSTIVVKAGSGPGPTPITIDQDVRIDSFRGTATIGQ